MAMFMKHSLAKHTDSILIAYHVMLTAFAGPPLLLQLFDHFFRWHGPAFLSPNFIVSGDTVHTIILGGKVNYRISRRITKDVSHLC